MSELPHYPILPEELRAVAESLLKSGMAAGKGHFLGMEALSVLFKLASSPDSASDSLKVLHEFQTHQIEIDLQSEQNAANARENAVDLAHYKHLYEFAPVGYFSINAEGRITESNLAGAAMLGSDCQELDGHLLENFLTLSSRSLVTWQLKKLFNGSLGETCILQALDSVGEEGLLRSFAKLAPNGKEVFMTLSKQESLPVC